SRVVSGNSEPPRGGRVRAQSFKREALGGMDLGSYCDSGSVEAGTSPESGRTRSGWPARSRPRLGVVWMGWYYAGDGRVTPSRKSAAASLRRCTRSLFNML